MWVVQSQSWRCKSSLFYYLYFFTMFYYLINFYCISILIIGMNEIILLLMTWKRWSRQCYNGHLHVLMPWDLSYRWRILRQDRDVSRVPSTLSLWKICYGNSWCTLEFSTIWKWVHTTNLNIVKYLAIIWKYNCEYYYMNLNPVWIWNIQI
jgi:hypothetical protein